MSSLSPVITAIPDITNASAIPRPPGSSEILYVSPFTLSMTVFILGSLLILITTVYAVIIVFGRPMGVAQATAYGGTIIQHFDTPKSATMKTALVTGGGFRYGNIRDGTVAATSNSVNSRAGRTLVLTFAQLGVTIPIPILAAISTLVREGVNDIHALLNKYSHKETEVVKVEAEDEEFGDIEQEGKSIEDRNAEEQIQTPKTIQQVISFDKIDDHTLIEGYDFNDFKHLLKQTKEENNIPLVVEAVPNFVTKNISSDINEKQIKVRESIEAPKVQPVSSWKIFTIGLVIIMIFIVGMAVK